METAKYAEFAEALVFVHGARARAEAAMHADLCLRAGDTRMVSSWTRVMDHLNQQKMAQFSRQA